MNESWSSLWNTDFSLWWLLLQSMGSRHADFVGSVAVRAFLSFWRVGATLVVVCGLLIVVASLVVEHAL